MKTLATLTATLLIGSTDYSMAQSMQMLMKASPAASAVSAMPLVNGEVRKLDLATGLIVLRHLAMPAMTMGFEIADKKMLDGFKVGDKVRRRTVLVVYIIYIVDLMWIDRSPSIQ